MTVKRIICAFIALMIIICCCSCEQKGSKSTDERFVPKLRVHFVDVGQGDCILMESAHEFVLIDAGEREYSDRVIDYIKEQGANRLKYVIATHPHSDHIGGTRSVLNTVDADNFITKESDSDTLMWTRLLKTVADKGINYIDAKAGDTYSFGESTFTIMGPLSDTYEEYNSASVVIKARCGDISFLLTGDSDYLSNNEMIDSGEDLTADVLKLGHHGSNDATSSGFLQAVDPMFAVISCGKDNDYGHPSKETMQKLELIGCESFRTDTQGAIVAVTDGQRLHITTVYDSAEGNYTAGGRRHDLSPLDPVGNRKSMLFHDPTCDGVASMNPNNKVSLSSRSEAIAQGYKPCSACKP